MIRTGPGIDKGAQGCGMIVAVGIFMIRFHHRPHLGREDDMLRRIALLGLGIAATTTFAQAAEPKVGDPAPAFAMQGSDG